MIEYRDIPGWEGYYQATNDGRIWSVPRIDSMGREQGGRFLSQKTRKDGYREVNLSRDNHGASRAVHALVCAAFHGPCPDGMECCHGPGGRLSNMPENLSWGTKSKNMGADKVRDGDDNRGEKHGNQWITNDQIHQIRQWLSEGKPQWRIADWIGCSDAQISRIKSGTNRQHLNTPGLWIWDETTQTGRWLRG